MNEHSIEILCNHFVDMMLLFISIVLTIKSNAYPIQIIIFLDLFCFENRVNQVLVLQGEHGTFRE